MRCAACKGVYHPITGHVFTEETVLCGPCAREFYKWYKLRMAQMDHPTKKSKGGTFSAAVVKSIHGEGPNMYKEETGICVRCGDTTHMPPLVERPESDLCHGCWEVESRLEGYLKNPKARSYVEQELAKAYSAAKK